MVDYKKFFERYDNPQTAQPLGVDKSNSISIRFERPVLPGDLKYVSPIANTVMSATGSEFSVLPNPENPSEIVIAPEIPAEGTPELQEAAKAALISVLEGSMGLPFSHVLGFGKNFVQHLKSYEAATLKERPREIDVIVLCAREAEYQKLFDTFKRKYRSYSPSNPRRFGALATFEVPYGEKDNSFLVALGSVSKMGNIDSAVVTSRCIAQHSPRLCVFAGIAGSLSPQKLRAGDIVLPKKISSRRIDKFEETDGAVQVPKTLNEALANARIEFRNDEVDIDEVGKRVLGQISMKELTSKLKDLKLPKSLKDKGLYTEKSTSVTDEEGAFSWEAVLASSDIATFIKEFDRAAVSLDMESLGFVKAVLSMVEMQKQVGADDFVGGVVVRAISDYCVKKSETDKKHPELRELAWENMARTVCEILEHAFPNAILRRN